MSASPAGARIQLDALKKVQTACLALRSSRAHDLSLSRVGGLFHAAVLQLS